MVAGCEGGVGSAAGCVGRGEDQAGRGRVSDSVAGKAVQLAAARTAQQTSTNSRMRMAVPL